MRMFYCRTNLDGYQREEWPKDFLITPQIGHRVIARSGRSLKICEISHEMMKIHEGAPIPTIILELNK